ncbi:hypothetical protein [Falsiphaeobacter marinintestinus]|uniref:hypothetical protein n=1 Tax=Falsiphaeobacter marinintestinus TaxID=1492905 RepID=UPI0011B7AE59|nr:hypothetical protein [Phaeobacter marinintestinus]
MIFWWQSFLQRVSEAVPWSLLGAIGRSNLGRLTILVPFVGYLIIFNPNFVNFFESSLPSGDVLEPSIAVHIHAYRLYFLYFGLLFMGLGVLLFNGLAPEPIRKFASVSEYVSEMEDVKSRSLVSSRLDEVVSNFLSRNTGEARSPFFSIQHPSFPGKPSFFLHDLVADILSSIPLENLQDESVSLPGPEPYGSLYRASPHAIPVGDGFVTTDEAMERMFESGITAEMVFLSIFRDRAFDWSKQVFFVDFVSANFLYFQYRLVTVFLFVISFLCLAVPTVTTSALVIEAALDQ